MDNVYKRYAKKNLYTVLMDCELAGITPEELYHELANTKISLVKKTIDTMFTPMSKKIDKLLFLLKIMAQLLQISTLVLEKSGYNVETEQKTLDYVNALLASNKKTTQSTVVAQG